jgi:hypothetical protein
MPPQLIVCAAWTTLRMLPWISLAFLENLLEIQLFKEYHLKHLVLGGLTAPVSIRAAWFCQNLPPTFFTHKKRACIVGSFNLIIQPLVYSILKIFAQF